MINVKTTGGNDTWFGALLVGLLFSPVKKTQGGQNDETNAD